MTLDTYVRVFIAVMVLVNPLEGIPFYLSRTQGAGPGVAARLALRAAIAVTLILLFSLLLGRGVLALFGVNVAAFQAAGGLVILLISLQMVMGGGTGTKAHADPEEDQDVAVVPLGTPLLAGPGPISTAILYATQSSSWENTGILAGIMVLVGVATYAFLRAAVPAGRLLKTTGISVATRLMGLLVAAIAVEMILKGGVQQVLALLSQRSP